MPYNLGYSDLSGYNLGYTGAYASNLYPYVLINHGVPEENSLMESKQFDTLQPVDIGVETDFDPADVVVDWQAISDGQLWLQDVNTLAAVDVRATTDTLTTATLRYSVRETGETGTFDVTLDIGLAPQGVVTIGTITVDTDTASIPFTYSDADQDGIEYSLNGGAWTEVTSPISLTTLDPDTTYSIEIRAYNTYGTSKATSSFTTDSIVNAPAGDVAFGVPSKTATTITQPFTYSATDETGYQYRVNGGTWQAINASPVELTGLAADTPYSISVRAVNDSGPGATFSTSVATAAILQLPSGTISFGTPSFTETTITQPFTYSETDQTGFRYRVDGGAWISTSSPIEVAGLTAGTPYLIEVQAVSQDGAGVTYRTTVTTAELAVPQGDITFGTVAVTPTAATVPFTYTDTDQTGFEYRVNGGTWFVTTSPVGLADLNPSTSYTVEVRAVNANGPGASYPVTLVTDALSPPAGTVSFSTPNVGQTTITQPFTYNASDQTGFEYQLNSGTWVAITASPVSLTGLNANTSYAISVRAVNNEGTGTTSTVTVSTLNEQTTTPGTSSGAYAFNMSVDDIIEEAYERIGMEVGSGYDLRTARRSLNLLLTEWVNKEITLWTMERRSIQCVAGQAEYELREYDVDVLEVALRTSGADTVLSRVSWHESAYTPNKDQAGRPIQYKFDRQIKPKIVLWPVPDNSKLSLVVDVFKYIEDVGSYINVVGAPRRFLPAMVAGLAYLLAEKRAPALVAQKKAMYDELLMQAMNADEEVKSFTVRPASSRTRYR